MRTSLAALIFALGLFAAPVYSQEKGGDDETGPTTSLRTGRSPSTVLDT